MASVEEVESRISELVVKALVVLPPAAAPTKGLAAVTAFVEGVASLRTGTVCVCPLCKAGLPQGSASKFSKESLPSRLDFGGDSSGEASLEGACISRDDGDASSVFSDTLAVLICWRTGRDGSGRSRTL